VGVAWTKCPPHDLGPFPFLPADCYPKETDSMLAERTPPLSLFARVVTLITRRVVLRAPRFTLGCCLVLGCLSALYAWQVLQLKTSRLDLLNPSSPFHQRWIAYLEEFGEDDDAVVVVEGSDPRNVSRVLDELGRRLDEAGDLFRSVLHRVDTERLESKGLFLLKPTELARIVTFTEEMLPVIREDWEPLTAAQLLLGTTRTLLAHAAAEEIPGALPVRQVAHSADPGPLAAEREAADVLESLLLAVEAPTSYRFPGGSLGELPRALSSSGHLTADDGRLGFILVSIARTSSGILPDAEDVQQLKRLVAEVSRDNPDVEVGLTGLPILEHDEMHISRHDMTRATICSLVGVSVLFVVGFGHWRLPLLAVGSLLIALTWSFGYIALSVGHLNILSISFGAILIGLGIDFGIHLLARFAEIRRQAATLEEAITTTVSEAGPGLTTGAVTTALAFGAAAMTHFTGIAELGVIAGGGVLLCLIASLVALPALLMMAERGRPLRAAPHPLPIAQACRPATQHAGFALVMTLLTTAVLATGLPRLAFDHNLLNLQPEDLPSVIWERRLLAQGDQSVWFAVSMADSLEEIVQRKEELRTLPSVSRVEEVASLLLPPSPDHVASMSEIGERLSRLPATPPPLPLRDPRETALQFRQAIDYASQQLTDVPELASFRQGLRRLREAIGQVSPAVCGTRLQQFESSWAQDIWQRLTRLAEQSHSAPPTIADLPLAWRDRFISPQGRYLLRIFAQGDIWSMDRLEQFVREIERVDPRVTGHPVQTFYASRQMQQSYTHAAVYATLAVLMVLMIDFRSFRASLFALVPLGLGILQLFGLLGLLGIPLNAANMIVLPLIIGIGLDDGVHVVHDYRRQARNYALGNATAAAIVLTSATTMLGFGSLMMAHHQGLRSLGQVLTIGVFCCMMSSLVTLPALLALYDRFASAQAARHPARLLPSRTPAPRAP
jgi:uncharacterized protein